MAAEGSKRRSKFFWLEGVTEAEVVRSLNDARPSRLRQQGPRRTLVISDAPDELLDERQIAVRDAAHTVAYRLLALVGSVAMVLHLVSRHPHGAPAAVAGADVTMLLIAFVMSAAFLPALVLAWNLPSEQPDA